MNKESRSYVPIIAAVITGGATLTAALVANWDKLFPKPPSDSTEIVATADATPSTGTTATPRPTQNPTTPTTPVASPTLTPLTPLPPAPTQEDARLEGTYTFVTQNFEPRPSSSFMEVMRASENSYIWRTSGLFNGAPVSSHGELIADGGGEWRASIDGSDDSSVVTRGRVPVNVAFDGALLTITDPQTGRAIKWRKR
jgi:hypothetical protein